MLKCLALDDRQKKYVCSIDPVRAESRCIEREGEPLVVEACPSDSFMLKRAYNHPLHEGGAYNRALYRLDDEFRSLPSEEQVVRLDRSGALRDGQLVFQTIPASMAGTYFGINIVNVINAATDSRINHVGILRRVNGHWRVIEAEATGVRYTKLRDFIRRDAKKYWIKEFSFLKGQPAKIARFVEAAHRFYGKPYDYGYGEGGDKIYCSELMDKALSALGKSLNNVKIPAIWLNGYDRSVRMYLALYHRVLNPENTPADWIMLPPHMLFYSNELEDPENLPIGFVNEPRNQHTPDNLIFDTIPGATLGKKFDYIAEKWGKHLNNIMHRIHFSGYATTPTAHHFRYFEEDKTGNKIQHSLTLFTAFSEEMALIKKLVNLLR